MRILYLDDSGKIHPHDPSKFVVFAGFSVDEEAWHSLLRQIAGVKSAFFPNRGNPNEWEIKSTDYLDKNNWKRAKKRRFCFELPRILRDNGCYVYAVSMEKAKANDELNEEKFVPLAFHRLSDRFFDEVTTAGTTGSIVCDWSTHQLDRYLTKCVSAMIIARSMLRLRGSVTYGSSVALPPLQVADLISGTMRRSAEGDVTLADLAKAFRDLHYTRAGQKDVLDYSVDSVFRLF